MRKILVMAVLSFALFATPAMAKDGLYLGGLLMWNDLSEDASSLDAGGGWGLRAGVGIGRYFAVEGTLFNTDHDYAGGTADFMGLTVDAKLSFPLSGSDIEPYIKLGVGTFELDAGTDYDGEGTNFGFGVDIYFAPELALGLGYTKRNISMDPDSFNVDVDSLEVALTYHFL